MKADEWMLYHHLSTFAGDGATHSECRVHDSGGRCSPPSPSRRWFDRFRAAQKAPWTTGRRCEPHDGPGAPQCPARRTLQRTDAGDVSYIEPFRRRVTATKDGLTVVDTERALLVHRPGQPPDLAFPAEDVDGVRAQRGADIPGFVTVTWHAVDAWFEEDEQMFGHPRNPYHRVDCVRSHRLLHVEAAGAILVDTTETMVVYETALEPRLYVDRRHVARVS